MGSQQKLISLSSLTQAICIKKIEWITMPYEDKDGRLITLSKINHQHFGVLIEEKNGDVRFLPAERARNVVNPYESGDILLKRLYSLGLVPFFSLLYREVQGRAEVVVVPPMIAAGKNEYLSGVNSKQINERYLKQCGLDAHEIKAEANLEGPDSRYNLHVNKDTKEIFILDNDNQGEPQYTGRFLNENGRGHQTQYKIIAFTESVQKEHLGPSVNASGSEPPIESIGGGSPGGVGNQVGIIEGLEDSPELIGTRIQYILCEAGPNQTMPFTEQELQRIIREMAIGIYHHQQVPFFSRHFQKDGKLYPIIHPAYEGTLVGKVVQFNLVEHIRLVA